MSERTMLSHTLMYCMMDINVSQLSQVVKSLYEHYVSVHFGASNIVIEYYNVRRQ